MKLIWYNNKDGFTYKIASWENTNDAAKNYNALKKQLETLRNS